MIASFFADLFQILQSLFVTIPTDNALGSIYAVLNIVFQLLVGFLGGDVDIGIF